MTVFLVIVAVAALVCAGILIFLEMRIARLRREILRDLKELDDRVPPDFTDQINSLEAEIRDMMP